MANGIPQAIVISGPSGSGKTTLVKKLMAEFDGYFAFSVSRKFWCNLDRNAKKTAQKFKSFSLFQGLHGWLFFLPEASFGLRVLSLPASVCVSVCLSVRLCVNHLLVRALTRVPFKLGSPNLDQRCKRPWLRSLLFCGLIDLDLQGQI